MKKLTLPKIEQVLNVIRDMQLYRYEIFNHWSDYVSSRGLYIARAELIAIWKIYQEVGISIPFPKFKEMSIEYDEISFPEEEFDLEEYYSNFVYTSPEHMLEMGWIEENHYICRDMLKKGKNNLNICVKEDVIKNIFGEYANIFTCLNDFISYVGDEDYYPDTTLTMKSDRAGRYLQYEATNDKISETNLSEMIHQCLETIVNPYHCYYTFFTYDKLHNGTLYAFTSIGNFAETGDGEFISVLHGKLYRRLCIEILNLLLTEAENIYQYNSNSLQ